MGWSVEVLIARWALSWEHVFSFWLGVFLFHFLSCLVGLLGNSYSVKQRSDTKGDFQTKQQKQLAHWGFLIKI